jgi:glycosyltransferase involved in cell wall biosynthesis
MARASAALCRELARRGHDVTVVTARLDPAHPPEEHAGGVRVRRLPGPAFLARRLMPWGRGLRRCLGCLPGVDVAHLHGHRSGLAVAARRLLAAAGVPWVLGPHGTYPHHGQHRSAKRVFDRLLGDAVVSRAHALIALSEAEARELPRPARVIPNGVLAPTGSAGVPRDNARLLFVGTDRPQKRGLALPGLLASLPATRLTLVGSFGPAFREHFAAFGARVEFAGVLPPERLGRIYAGAAVLVHPAAGEAFGLVPFEAALCGTPAVVAGGHGCGEWFGRAGGCVVAPDEPDALAAAVARRLGEPALGAAEAGAVAVFARRELTWENAAARVEGVYREVLDAAGMRAAG